MLPGADFLISYHRFWLLPSFSFNDHTYPPQGFSQWWETGCVHTMQLFSQSSFSSKTTHDATHWREALSMQPMQLFFKSIKPSETAQSYPFWGKASKMHNVWVFSKIHMIRKHTEERLFKCGQCKFACTASGNLQQHTITHTRGKPFKCNKCNTTFTQKNYLTKHFQNHMTSD